MRVGSNFIYLDYADSDTEQTLSLIAPDPRKTRLLIGLH